MAASSTTNLDHAEPRSAVPANAVEATGMIVYGAGLQQAQETSIRTDFSSASSVPPGVLISLEMGFKQERLLEERRTEPNPGRFA